MNGYSVSRILKKEKREGIPFAACIQERKHPAVDRASQTYTAAVAACPPVCVWVASKRDDGKAVGKAKHEKGLKEIGGGMNFNGHERELGKVEGKGEKRNVPLKSTFFLLSRSTDVYLTTLSVSPSVYFLCFPHRVRFLLRFPLISLGRCLVHVSGRSCMHVHWLLARFTGSLLHCCRCPFPWLLLALLSACFFVLTFTLSFRCSSFPALLSFPPFLAPDTWDDLCSLCTLEKEGGKAMQETSLLPSVRLFCFLEAAAANQFLYTGIYCSSWLQARNKKKVGLWTECIRLWLREHEPLDSLTSIISSDQTSATQSLPSCVASSSSAPFSSLQLIIRSEGRREERK